MSEEHWMYDSKGEPSKQIKIFSAIAKRPFEDKRGVVHRRKAVDQWIADFAKRQSQVENRVVGTFYETNAFCDFILEYFRDRRFKACPASFRYLEDAWEDFKAKTDFYQATLDEAATFYPAVTAQSGEIEDETNPPTNVFWLHAKRGGRES